MGESFSAQWEKFLENGLDKYPEGVYYKNTPWGYIGAGGTEMGSQSCDCHKTKERSPEEVKQLVHRLNRVEGQIRGIRGMVEKSAYCPDILAQVAAANAALNAFSRELLAEHIRTCVARDVRQGHEETLDELVATIQKLMK